MSAETLRGAAASIRADHEPWHASGEFCDHPSCENDRFMQAVADWLDAEAESHIHVPGSDRTRAVYDMPGMDTAPAVRVARAYLGEAA